MTNVTCPKCEKHKCVIKHGYTKSTGEQRYFCVECKKSFQHTYKSKKFEDINKMAAIVIKAFTDPDMPTIKEKAEKFGTTPYMLRKLRGEKYEGAQREKEKRLARLFREYKQEHRLDIVCPRCKIAENVICKKINVPNGKMSAFRYDCILYCDNCKNEFRISKHKRKCTNVDCGSYDISKHTEVKVKQTGERRQIWKCKECGRYFRSSHNTYEQIPYADLKKLLEQMSDIEIKDSLEQIPYSELKRLLEQISDIELKNLLERIIENEPKSLLEAIFYE